MSNKYNVMDKIVNAIGAVMLSVMILATAVNVVSTWFGSRSGAVDDLIQCVFVWVVYIGIGSLYSKGEQISVPFLVNMMPDKVQRVMNVFVDVVMLVTSCFFAYYALKLTVRGASLLTPVLKLPFSYVDIAVVLGFLYVIIDLGIKFIRFVIKLFSGGKKDAY